MRKQAKDLKKGDKIKMAELSCTIEETELSDIGKQGKKKCRLVLTTEKGEKLVIVRPEDYPFESP
jgi:translation elongation factor P/translation initiation factor 5A